MPAERIAMRQVRDVLRLKAAGVSGNEIARRVGVAPSTVRLTLKRLAVAGLGWPLPAEMTDAALGAQLFAAVGTKQGHRRRAEPDELNAAIGELLRQLNEERPIRRLGVTRRALLEELDRPHLKELPCEPYAFAEWRLPRVGVDYHVEVEAHFYSVPYRFARREVEVRLTPRTVEVFLKGERIAAHPPRRISALIRCRVPACRPLL